MLTAAWYILSKTPAMLLICGPLGEFQRGLPWKMKAV